MSNEKKISEGYASSDQYIVDSAGQRTAVILPIQQYELLLEDLHDLAVVAERREEKFTGVFEQVGEWWIGYVEELPGANTQGKTLDEARENLQEATQLIIEANRELVRREMEGKPIVREELLVAM
ncbi:MAG: type II toxin-antitoxin system HicB family antitoxin [Chloroflexota bacterium]